MSDEGGFSYDLDLSISQSTYSAGSRVGAKAELADVRTFKVAADLHDFGAEPPYASRIDMAVDISPVSDSGVFVVQSRYDIAVYPGDSEGEGERHPIAEISVGIAGLYRSEGLPDDLTDDELGAFGVSSAAMALHPYMREAVSAVSQRFGLPSLLIPPLRIYTEDPSKG